MGVEILTETFRKRVPPGVTVYRYNPTTDEFEITTGAESKDVVIESGTSLSESVEIGGYGKLAFIIPANWTTASLSFTGSDKLAGTYVPIIGSTGDEITISATASKATVLSTELPFRFIKLQSGTSASKVNQVGTGASFVATVDTGKTLTFTSVIGGQEYNDITITLTTADDDNLAVTGEGDTITVALATTTDSKNAAAAIQTAVQAIDGGEVAGVDITSMTVAGNAAYNSAPLAGVKATKAYEITTGKTLTITSGVTGPESNDISFTFVANDSDALAVAEEDGLITVSLAMTTDSNNSAAAIQTALQAIEGGEVAGVDITGMTASGNEAYNSSPPVTVSPAIADVALEDGADSIADDVVADENLTDGGDTTVTVCMKA